MSKIAEKKAKDIAKKLEASQAYKFDNFSVVCGAIEGYDQAMQDFLEKAEKFFKNELYVSVSDQICSHNNFTSMSNFVEYFKNYMKDE